MHKYLYVEISDRSQLFYLVDGDIIRQLEDVAR